VVSLSELDRRIIGLVSDQRVVTSTQLEFLLADVPGRTLRYRTDHLHRAGLLGRSRPYRERGSAPYHLWPSRRADTLARGAPAPRGGERAEPNPLFLAHAAGLTELYALLATQTPGVRLARFDREPREPFTAEGRSRTLAPDALVELHDGQGLGLLAFVELDLGTMSHARLKVKAGAYAAYAAQAAWTERYDFCPCLLFITTTEARAVAFLKALAALLQRAGRGGFYDNRAVNVSWFAACACAMARESHRALGEPCWDDLTLSGGGLCLIDCLRAARAPYDAALAEQEAALSASEAERERLRSDPDAWRALLQEHRLYARSEHFEQFGTTAVLALELLLSSTRPMESVERSAFTAVARQLDPEPLEGRLALEPVPASAEDREAVARLADAYRACQRERVAQLAQRYGSGPKLRLHQEQLSSGGLIDVFASERLEQDAARDHQARAEQEQLRIGYLQRREQEAKHRKYDVPLSVRLTQGRAALYALVDRERLHICHDCDEVVYPSEPADESHGYLVEPARREPARCHFCGAYNLDGWDEHHMPGLLYGGTYRRSDLDLRSAGGSDLLDRERLFGDEQEEQWS
jgi:hypothetical protein